MGSDLNRLRPHEFLNDTLIEFGLKYDHLPFIGRDADIMQALAG
jgi:hypothetical protein